MNSLDDFLHEAIALAGQESVEADLSGCRDAIGLTFPWPTTAQARISPSSETAVPALLAAATRHRVPIHPVSRGRGWGLGGAMPGRPAVILDLSRLSQILELDADRGIARVQPGVTFVQLQQRLKAEGLRYHVPGFGGPPDASVLANALERGEGTGSKGDRFGNLWDLDVALATGERLSTGTERHGQAALWSARPAGPLLEGLFSQSAFGVVLSGRIGLQPTLPFVAAVQGEFAAPDVLPAAVARLARLIEGGLVPPHAVALWDGAKRRATGSFETDGQAPGWGCSIVVGGVHPQHFRMTLDLVRAELAAVCNATVVHDDRDADGRRLATPLTGFSDGRNVRAVYAGKPDAWTGSPDPVRDACGFLWLCPTVPMDGGAVAELAARVEAAAASEMHPAIGLQAVTSHCLHGYVSLAWDRSVAGLDALAMRTHDTLVASLTDAGYAPYRLGIASAAAAKPPGGATPAVLGRLRAALDPAGILSPGRVPGLDTAGPQEADQPAD